jgi:hypothetical protein
MGQRENLNDIITKFRVESRNLEGRIPHTATIPQSRVREAFEGLLGMGCLFYKVETAFLSDRQLVDLINSEKIGIQGMSLKAHTGTTFKLRIR